ncbi:TolC family protein [Candidatus Fermentibacteria bacterium]|nr:TolC family protein [Candidatus Fermentibacteria bacterium]
MLLLLLLSLAFARPGDVAARTLSLDDARLLALASNEQILIAEQDERKAAGAVTEAYAGALPSIALQAQYSGNFKKPAFFLPSEFFGGGEDSANGGENGENSSNGPVKIEIGSDTEFAGALRLDQTLYAFGRVGNAVKFASIYRKMAGVGVKKAQSDVVFGVTEAYYRVLLLEKLVQIQRQALEQARSHFDDIQEKHTQGMESRFALQRAEVEAKNRAPDLIRAENAMALALQDLKRIVGIIDEENPVLVDTLGYEPMTAEMKGAWAEAEQNRPEMRVLDLNVLGQERVLAIYKANMLPVVGAFGQVSLQGQANKDDLMAAFDENSQVSISAGVVFSAPIFDGFRTKGKVQQARAALLKARFEQAQARKAIRLDVTRAVQDLQGLTREYEAQRATVELAEDMFRIAETRFKSGISTQLELNDAELALNLARTNYAETLYRYNVAVATLERALGRTAGAATETIESGGPRGQEKGQ